MTLSVLVPANLQIGVVDITKARPVAVQRRLQLAVQRHVFDSQAHLDLVLARFEARLGEFKVSDKAAKDYWRRLNAPTAGTRDESSGTTLVGPDIDGLMLNETGPESDAMTGTTAPEGGSGTTVPADESKQGDRGPKAALFCLAFHGVSGAFAAERLGTNDSAEENPESDADGEEFLPVVELEDGTPVDPEAEEEPAISDTPPEILFSSARKAVANLLRSRSWRALREVTTDPTKRDEILGLTASVLLEVLVEVLDDWFEIVQERKGAPRRIVLKDPDLTARLDRLLAEMPFDFTPQPLREAVRYELDGRRNEDEGEGFRVDLIDYRRRNAFIAKFHEGVTDPVNRSQRFGTYVEAVNAQMAVAWRINRPLYEIVDTLIAAVTPSSNWESQTAEALILADLSEEEMEGLSKWVLTKLFRPKKQRRRGADGLAGEFLDHKQAQTVLRELVAQAVQAPESRFYLCWKADFRGRIYAHTPWLTPQGSDVQRALFEFAEGRKLDENGLRALRRHGANLVSSDRILRELEVKGRRVATLEEREAWVELNEDQILACAANPLRERFWREKEIKKPIQFLGFCLAYAQWKSDPESPIHLPTQIDGTCNGLQHIAALTGDEKLARAVNVLPRPDGLPSDVYSEVADAAVEDLAGLVAGGDTLTFGDRWLSEESNFQQFLDRDTAKAVVMVVPYGAARETQMAAVLRKNEAKFVAAWREKAELGELPEFVASVRKDPKRRAFVEIVTKGWFEELRKEAERCMGAERTDARDKLFHLQIFSTYVALAIVNRVNAALDSRFPIVKIFTYWLNSKAKAASGLPLIWLTPLGFPVCQNKFCLTGGSITASLRGTTERLDVRRLSTVVDRNSQRSSLLPNLIHSFDATHLAMVIVAAKADGIYDIGTVHDCLLCHPNDADRLAEIARQQFAQLYAPDETGAPATRTNWETWMDLLGQLDVPQQAHNVLAVLADPDGYGARLFEGLAQSDPEAKRAHSLLPTLHKLDPPTAYLATMILEYHKFKDDVNGDEQKGDDNGQGAPGPDMQQKPKKRRKSKSKAPDLNCALSLDQGQAISRYMFS